MEKQTGGVTISKRALIIILIIILLLICGGVIVGVNWSSWFGDGSSASQSYSPDLDPNAGEWSGSQVSDSSDGETEGIKIPGYPSITLPAGEETVSVALLNPEGNPCYFTFTLVLKDTNEVLYTSKQVPPGQAITSITMSRALEAGEYDAVIQITTASLEDGSAMNGANVETTLIVE